MEPLDSGRIPPPAPVHLKKEEMTIEKNEKEKFDVSAQLIKKAPPSKKSWRSSTESISQNLEFHIGELDSIESEVDAHFKTAEAIQDLDIPSLEEWVKENAPLWVDVILAKGAALEKFNQFFTQTLAAYATPVGHANVFIGGPLGYFSQIRDLHGIGKETAVNLGYLGFAGSIPANLGMVGFLICRIVIYKEIANELKKMKARFKEDPSLKPKIDEVKNWLALHKAVLRRESLATSLMLFGTSLQLTRLAIKTTTALGHGLGVAAGYVGVGLGGISSALFLLQKTMKLVKTAKAEKVHRKWIAEHDKAKLIIQHASTKELKIEEIETVARKQVSDLLEKRKAALEERRAYLRGLIDDLENQSFEEGKKSLKEAGIYIPLESTIHSKNQLMQAFVDNKATNDLIEETIQRQDTVSQLTRNGLKAQSLKKQRLEHRFSKFKLGSSAVSLALAVISTAVLTTLTVSILVGAFTFPPLGLALVGLGFTLATIAVIAAGALYFYSQKPSLMKEWLKGVNARLAIYAIPSSYRAFTFQLQKIKQLKKAFVAHELSVKMHEIQQALAPSEEIDVRRLPRALQPLVQKYRKNELSDAETARLQEKLRIEHDKVQKKIAQNAAAKLKIDERIAKAEKKLKYWEELKAPLEGRLVNAGLRDFLKKARLDQDYAPVPFSQIIAEGILQYSPQKSPSIDPEIVEILTEKMGIKLDQIAQMDNKIAAQKALIPLLDAYFAQKQEKIISYIQKQYAEKAYMAARSA